MQVLADSAPDAQPSPLTYTSFQRHDAATGARGAADWPDLCDWIERSAPVAPTKAGLPLIKLATFTGDHRSNSTLEALSGVEGDYDAGAVQPADAADRLALAGIEALVVTTPSHRPDAPRWRVLCPLSVTLPPVERHGLVARLNGALGGVLAAESFTASQAFYVGAVEGGEPVQCWRVQGRTIDRVDGEGVGPAQSAGDRQPLGTLPTVAVEHVTAALREVDAEQLDYADWRNVTAAYRGAGGEREPWERWCDGWGTNDAADRAKLWASLDAGTALGWSYLQAQAPLAAAGATFGGEPAPLPTGASATPLPLASGGAVDPAVCWFRPCDLSGPVPTREWLVPDMVPSGTVTLLGGDGGTGKSLIAMQLAVATAHGGRWLDRQPGRGPALYLSAEDDEAELHRRLASVSAGAGVALADLSALTVASMAGGDALLATLARNGTLEPTALLSVLSAKVEATAARLVVLDTLADLFPGNENDRAQARQFVALLRGLAIRHGCAVLLLAHPSKAGLVDGSGLSGSTAWNNSVRSRLYFERVREEGVEPDPDVRRLKVLKNNYGRTGDELTVRYLDGAFVPVWAGLPGAGDAKAERVFLACLRQRNGQGLWVNPTSGANYGPSQFATMDVAEGVTKRQLAKAMERLFNSGAIIKGVVSENGKNRTVITEPAAN